MEILIGISIRLWWAHYSLKTKATPATSEYIQLNVVQQGRHTYWLAEGRLVRSRTRRGRVDFASTQLVDPLHCRGLDPVEALDILTPLEEADSAIGGSREE